MAYNRQEEIDRLKLKRWSEACGVKYVEQLPVEITEEIHKDDFEITVDSQEYIADCRKFARTRAGIPDYADNGQVSENKRYDDELICKIGEFAVNRWFAGQGITTSFPDLNIYPSWQKSHGADLKILSSNTPLHIKSTNYKWPWFETWTFQYHPRQDPIISGNCSGYFFGCGVSETGNFFVVKILCIILANTVKNYLSEPNLAKYHGLKKVIRLTDIGNPYDFPLSWRKE